INIKEQLIFVIITRFVFNKKIELLIFSNQT
ncbi:unnamed protein product, partial [marine sediment metagenome]